MYNAYASCAHLLSSRGTGDDGIGYMAAGVGDA
jgi:hypothetical protein